MLNQNLVKHFNVQKGNELGSNQETCEQFGGKCSCKMNVEGKSCNTCARETWGLTTHGCQGNKTLVKPYNSFLNNFN